MRFTRLKGFEERKGEEHSLEAVLNRRAARCRIPARWWIPVVPLDPGRLGVRRIQMEIMDLGGGDINELAQVTQQIAAAGNQSGRVAGIFSAFTANDTQLVVTIDRDKARSLGLTPFAR